MFGDGYVSKNPHSNRKIQTKKIKTGKAQVQKNRGIRNHACQCNKYGSTVDWCKSFVCAQYENIAHGLKLTIKPKHVPNCDCKTRRISNRENHKSLEGKIEIINNAKHETVVRSRHRKNRVTFQLDKTKVEDRNVGALKKQLRELEVTISKLNEYNKQNPKQKQPISKRPNICDQCPCSEKLKPKKCTNRTCTLKSCVNIFSRKSSDDTYLSSKRRHSPIKRNRRRPGVIDTSSAVKWCKGLMCTQSEELKKGFHLTIKPQKAWEERKEAYESSTNFPSRTIERKEGCGDVHCYYDNQIRNLATNNSGNKNNKTNSKKSSASNTSLIYLKETIKCLCRQLYRRTHESNMKDVNSKNLNNHNNSGKSENTTKVSGRILGQTAMSYCTKTQKEKVNVQNAHGLPGQALFDVKVNSVDMTILNPKETLEKLKELGRTTQYQGTCCCPSHQHLMAKYKKQDRTPCSGGPCDRASRNKRKYFKCNCLEKRILQCTESTCNQKSDWRSQVSKMKDALGDCIPYNQANQVPLFDMRVEPKHMQITNANEIRKNLTLFEQARRSGGLACKTGICKNNQNSKYDSTNCYCNQVHEPIQCSNSTCVKPRKDCPLTPLKRILCASRRGSISYEILNGLINNKTNECINPATCEKYKKYSNQKPKPAVCVCRRKSTICNILKKTLKCKLRSDLSVKTIQRENKIPKHVEKAHWQQKISQRRRRKIQSLERKKTKLHKRVPNRKKTGPALIQRSRNDLETKLKQKKNKFLKKRKQTERLKSKYLKKRTDQQKKLNANEEKKYQQNQKQLERKRKEKERNEKKKHMSKEKQRELEIKLKKDKQTERLLEKKERKEKEKRDRDLKEQFKSLLAQEKGIEAAAETDCCADCLTGTISLVCRLVKSIFSILFHVVSKPRQSLWYVTRRAANPFGTYARGKRWLADFWALQKMKMNNSMTGSPQMVVFMDTVQDHWLYRTFLGKKGKTLEQRKKIERENMARKQRILTRDVEAIHGCRHVLLTTLRKRPCLCVYHICPNFYPQCLSFLQFYKNFCHLIVFFIAVLFWTPCLVACELCRALMCCTMCTA